MRMQRLVSHLFLSRNYISFEFLRGPFPYFAYVWLLNLQSIPLEHITYIDGYSVFWWNLRPNIHIYNHTHISAFPFSFIYPIINSNWALAICLIQHVLFKWTQTWNLSNTLAQNSCPLTYTDLKSIHTYSNQLSSCVQHWEYHGLFLYC